MAKNVFIDTNILIAMLECGKNPCDSKEVKFYTFEKCVYEYIMGFKRLLFDKTFIINCLKKKQSGEKDALDRYASEVIVKAGKSNPDDVIAAIKEAYELKSIYAVSKEKIYQSDEEFNELLKKYCSDNKLGNEHILSLFYKHINIYSGHIIRKIYKDIENYVSIIYYEQVFTNKNMAVYIREMIDDVSLPSSDIEIVFACLVSQCDVFLSTDKRLIDSCRTLGLNYATSFVYVNEQTPTKIIEDIRNILKDI